MTVPDSRDTPEVLRNITSLEAAEQRAFERGQQSAKLIAQVEWHERRLDAINGSVARHAQAQEQTTKHLDKLASAVAQGTAIAEARADDAKRASEAQVSTRTFLLGCFGIAVTVILAVLAAGGHV